MSQPIRLVFVSLEANIVKQLQLLGFKVVQTLQQSYRAKASVVVEIPSGWSPAYEEPWSSDPQGRPRVLMTHLNDWRRPRPTLSTDLILAWSDCSRWQVFSKAEPLTRYHYSETKLLQNHFPEHPDEQYRGALTRWIFDRTIKYDYEVQYLHQMQPVRWPAHHERVQKTAEERVTIEKTLMRRTTQWLDEHYPNWRDPSAYWDDPKPPTSST